MLKLTSFHFPLIFQTLFQMNVLNVYTSNLILSQLSNFQVNTIGSPFTHHRAFWLDSTMVNLTSFHFPLIFQTLFQMNVLNVYSSNLILSQLSNFQVNTIGSPFTYHRAFWLDSTRANLTFFHFSSIFQKLFQTDVFNLYCSNLFLFTPNYLIFIQTTQTCKNYIFTIYIVYLFQIHSNHKNYITTLQKLTISHSYYY